MEAAQEAEKAAEAKKRAEERKARRLAKREAEKAEAERQKKAAEENREENQRRAAIEAERKKEEKEAARKKAEAAAVRKAAAEARAAERERERERERVRERVREARMVVLRHVPIRASLFAVTEALESFKPGRILDSGVGEGTAWYEFWTAEQAQAVQRVVTETDQCVILGKTIKTASIYQGRTKPPEGPEFISRSLYIIAPSEFLDGEAKLYPVLEKKLREQGITIRPSGMAQGDTPTGKWVAADYASVAKAQSTKAALEKHYPELKVLYNRDRCEGVVSTAQEGAEMGSKSSKKGSGSWVNPVELAFYVVFIAIVAYIAAQQRSEDK